MCIIYNVIIYAKEVSGSLYFITLLHQNKTSVISALRRRLGQSDGI
jgi:hypothetical protein